LRDGHGDGERNVKTDSKKSSCRSRKQGAPYWFYLLTREKPRNIGVRKDREKEPCAGLMTKKEEVPLEEMTYRATKLTDFILRVAGFW